MPRAQYLPQLVQLFRLHGYDGASLSKISAATGLGKASLYHHFPRGKDEMVHAVLEHLESVVDRSILQVLREGATPQRRFQAMCDGINALYHGGEQPCIFAILLMGSARDVFRDKVKQLLQAWIDAIADVLITEGVDLELAHQQAEEAVISIQGALIVSQGLEDTAPFQRVLENLPAQLSRNLSNQ